MTTDAAHTTEADSSAWIKEHQVSWELRPMHEMVKEHGLQHTGYALQLFGRFDPVGHADPAATAQSIHGRLRLFAIGALEALPVRLAAHVAPLRAVVRLETPMVVEVELTIAAFPPDPAHPLPPAEVKRLIEAVGDRLRSLGLKKLG